MSMRKITIRMAQEPKARDLQAMSMWGNAKAQAFRDRRRILPRKAKHKGLCLCGF